MDKIVVEKTEQKPIVYTYKDGQNIETMPYIDLATKLELIQIYTNTLFGVDDIETNYVTAEATLALALVDKMTNLKVNEEGAEDNLDIEFILESGIYKEICGRIVNFDELRRDIHAVVAMKNQERSIESSVGFVLDALFNKVISYAESLPDISQEALSANVLKLGEEVGKVEALFSGASKKPAQKRGRKPKVKDE